MANAIRLVFVGCGSIARHHLKAVQASSYEGRVCAVVDKSRAVAEEFVSSTSQHNCEVKSPAVLSNMPKRDWTHSGVHLFL